VASTPRSIDCTEMGACAATVNRSAFTPPVAILVEWNAVFSVVCTAASASVVTRGRVSESPAAHTG